MCTKELQVIDNSGDVKYIAGYVVTWETPLGLLRRPIGDLI